MSCKKLSIQISCSKLEVSRAFIRTLYFKNISLPGKMSSYFMSGQLSPDYIIKTTIFSLHYHVLICQ